MEQWAQLEWGEAQCYTTRGGGTVGLDGPADASEWCGSRALGGKGWGELQQPGVQFGGVSEDEIAAKLVQTPTEGLTIKDCIVNRRPGLIHARHEWPASCGIA